MFSWRALLLHSCVVLLTSNINPVGASPESQKPLGPSPQDDWRKYVRSPATDTVRPVRVLSKYTQGNVTNPDGLLRGKKPTILTRPAPSSNVTWRNSDISPAIVVDFGQNIAGFLSISFGGAYNSTPGLPGIRLAFSETLQYLSDRSDFSRSYNGDSITPGSDQIAVKQKPYTWSDDHGCEYGNQVCSDGLHGFRYVKIYLDALPHDSPHTTSYGQVSIDSMSLYFTGYLGTPETFTGHFESSDEKLNQWWYDSVYTNDMCTDEFRVNDTDPRNAASPTLIGKLVLHDGPKRDRDPYLGDLAVSSRSSYLTHDVPEASRNVLADLADHQRHDGWIPPASINNYTLPLLDYPLWWVACSYDLFMYMGDVEYITKYYQTIINTLDNFYPAITDPKTQLITKGISFSGGYGDYAFLPRQGPVTYYNALYIIALDNAASIAKYLSREEDTKRWTERARNVSNALNEYNFDILAGAFYDGTCGSSYCQTHAQDGNSLSILSGAANFTRAKSILSFLSDNHARPWGNSFYDNDVISAGFSQRVYPFMSYFEIEARFLVGDADSALEEIRRLYGYMSSHDPEITVWEGIGSDGSPYEGPYTSMAHGWSTGIVPALTNYVLGVMPTGPAFTTWNIKPMPGDLKWASGTVPTPNGPIKVHWTKNSQIGIFSLSATTPEGTNGLIHIPVSNSSVEVFVNGQLAWGDNRACAFSATNVEGYVSIALEGGYHAITVGHNTI